MRRISALLVFVATLGAFAPAAARDFSGLVDPSLEALSELEERSANSGSGFPWCRCLNYDCRCSPYRLQVQKAEPVGVYTRQCFTVRYVGCDLRLPCCRGMLRGVDKVTFETTEVCSDRNNILTVRLNDQLFGSWNTYTHDTGYEFKIYNLRMSNETFPDTTICVTTRPPCAVLSDMCVESGAKGCRYSFADTPAASYCPICPVGRRSPPPAPPPELRPPRPPPRPAVPAPPTQPPAGCTTCVYIQIQPPPGTAPEDVFQLTPEVCDVVAGLVDAGVSAAAAEAGANITQPFGLAECSALYAPDASPPQYPIVKVCGEFASDEDGAKLQPWLDSEGLSDLLAVLTNGDCSGLEGYNLAVTVAGADGTESSSCLEGNKASACALESSPPPAALSPPPQGGASSPPPATRPPPPPPRSSPPPRPPPSPPPPPQPCVVCVYIAVQGEFNATKDMCMALAQAVGTLFASGADEVGASIAKPFNNLKACKSDYDPTATPPVYPTAKICGQFTSAADGAAMQSWLDSTGLSLISNLVIGDCPSSIAGKPVSVVVTGPNGPNGMKTCLYGTFMNHCEATEHIAPPPLEEYLAPPPPPPPPPPAGARSPPPAVVFRPPPSPPPQMTTPCSVCAYVTISGGMTFTQDECGVLAEWIATEFDDAAATYNATLSVPFELTSCSSDYQPDARPPVYPTLAVCGQFASDADGALLQPWLESALDEFLGMIASDCPADMTVWAVVTGPGGPNSPATCLAGGSSKACSPSSPPPPPGGSSSSPPAPVIVDRPRPPPARTPSPSPSPNPSPSPVPSPVPSPSPSGNGSLVQTHGCVQSRYGVPYNIMPQLTAVGVVDTEGRPGTAMCVRVTNQKTCRPSAFCCDMDFQKIEVVTSLACRSSVMSVSVNSFNTTSFAWATYDSFATLKLPDMPLLWSKPDGATICWVVRPGACATPEAFCFGGRCQVSIFSSDNKCCPTTLAGNTVKPPKPPAPPPRPPAPPSPPPAPPSPPPSTGACTSCLYFQLADSTGTATGSGFTPATCNDYGFSLSDELNLAALDFGAVMTKPYVLTSCNKTLLTICGEFPSSAEGQKLQSWATDYVGWLAAPDNCLTFSDVVAGYSVFFTFAGADGPASDSCIQAGASTACSLATPMEPPSPPATATSPPPATSSPPPMTASPPPATSSPPPATSSPPPAASSPPPATTASPPPTGGVSPPPALAAPPPLPLARTHICVQSANNVPYLIESQLRVTNTTTGADRAPAVAMCMGITPRLECATNSFCCGMSVDKIEVPMSNACRQTVQAVWFNNVPSMGFTYGDYDTFSTLKIPRLRGLLPEPGGASVCWVVPAGACSTPEAFCLNGRCQASIYSATNKCCPTTILRSGPPLPPAPPASSACTTCLYVQLLASGPAAGTGFSPDMCRYVAEAWTEAAQAAGDDVGVTLAKPYTVKACNATLIKVCGELASLEDAALLQPAAQAFFDTALPSFLDCATYATELAGYSVLYTLGGGRGPESTGCLRIVSQPTACSLAAPLAPPDGASPPPASPAGVSPSPSSSPSPAPSSSPIPSPTPSPSPSPSPSPLSTVSPPPGNGSALSPPPSPPPTLPLVRTHQCVQSTRNVPYVIEQQVAVLSTTGADGAAAVSMCMRVSERLETPAWAFCGAMAVDKVEVPISNACRQTVQGITINNVPSMAFTYGDYGVYATLKFPRLRGPLPEPAGAIICWVVPVGACSAPEAFCLHGQCQASLYSPNNKCCPTSILRPVS